jgi:hypothetical protein
MILPTKHLPVDRALLTVGSELLQLLDQPKTVSRLWNDLRESRSGASLLSPIPYDWFILALDLLHTVYAVEFTEGRVHRVRQ